MISGFQKDRAGSNAVANAPSAGPRFFLRYLCSLLLIGLSGCAADRLFTRTETVTPQVQTNALTQLVTTNYVTNVVFTVNPTVTKTLDTAQALAPLAPTPWAPAAAGALALSTAVLGWIAKRKSDHAALLPAIITGVESAANNETVKDSIQKIARASGLESQLNAVVQKITK